MTADTSWYGQQTLVHPDYSHQPYATYGDPYAGQQHYGYAAEQQHYAHGDPYAQQYAAAYPTQGHGVPDYYAQHPEATLVVDYAGHSGQPGYAHQGYDTYGAYAGTHAYGDYAYGGTSTYETVTTTMPFAGVPEQRPWDASATAAQPQFDATAVAPAVDDEPSSYAYGAASSPVTATPVAATSDADPDAAGETGPTAVARPDEGWTERSARRRPVRRRSAVLTIAVPSVAVLGVAGAAAATMGPLRAHHPTTTASADVAAQQTKAQALASQETRDAAERAARDKARTALQLREAAARKAAAEAPRFTLPIAYHTGLSALFGQAGTHWMQLHTGIDFPVPEGTPVHAVTGGTVTTEWNPFYGYMVKLTAPDGTVTWYCHLSSYRVRSGQVKVGDIIAYSGDTGNSTGPHLHFEVHPNGGPAVDPLPWLLARGLDPR